MDAGHGSAERGPVARQAVLDLAGQLKRAPLTTFEELFGPTSP